ncbi:hypothetical protein [Amycolatopsis sacchari]|uniref:hypothetical protein n=1 Tax=Amycolatopsis sacchari TaxID=115433 RepID=UPI003EB94C26
MSRSGEGVSSAGASIRDRITAFQSTLEGYGNPFGEDDIGSAMQEIYEAIQEAAMDSYTDNAETVTDVGDRIGEMAKAYREIETAHSDTLGQLREELGS